MQGVKLALEESSHRHGSEDHELGAKSRKLELKHAGDKADAIPNPALGYPTNSGALPGKACAQAWSCT